MPPAGGSKSKAYSSGIATQAEIEEVTIFPPLLLPLHLPALNSPSPTQDNTKLALRVLKSKKNIQRLRVERAILYDRLQSSAQPTNPFALHSTPHLSSLPQPPSIFHPSPVPLANPHGPELYLKELDARKLKAVKEGDVWGERPELGIEGEEKKFVREVSPLGMEMGKVQAGNGMQVDQ
ncbi:hypothetical protein P7C70_g6333, partial [Phenoliferia sp. Uapishka_3]